VAETDLVLNVRGMALEMAHMTVHHAAMLAEMNILHRARAPLDPAIAPPPRPASPPFPMAAREMPLPVTQSFSHSGALRSLAAVAPAPRPSSRPSSPNEGIAAELRVAREHAWAEEQRETAEALVDSLLLDLVADADVRRAVAQMPSRPVPWFAQLAGAPADWTFKPPPPPPLYSSPEEGAEVRPTVQAALDKQANQPEPDEAELRTALQETHEFRELCEEIMEGTIFNLLAEAVLGEYDITKLPRQIITNIEVTSVEDAALNQPEGEDAAAGAAGEPALGGSGLDGEYWDASGVDEDPHGDGVGEGFADNGEDAPSDA